MATSDDEQQPMAACGACSAVIPIDSSACPECGIRLAGEQQRWECGACGELFDHEPRSCSACGVVFVADDVVNVLRDWLSSNSMTVIDLFSRFDTNGDGIIDSSELKQGLLALNLAALPPDQVDILVQSIDENGDGSIDLNELQTTLDMDDVAIEEASADEGDGSLEFSENVLDRVMAEHGISEDDRAAFLEHAASFNEDENSYLKQDELKQAAAAWVELHAEGEEAEEASEEPFDQAPAEDEAEDLEEEADAEEPEATEDSIDEDADQADEEEDTSDDEPEEDESESDVSIEADEDEEDEAEEDEAEEDEGEEDEVEEDESEDLGVDTSDPFGALLEALDDMDITQMFHEVDTDGSGSITVDELHEAINTFTGLSFSRSQVEEIAQRIDEDSDGSIDRIEFIAAIEEQDGVVEPVVIPEKPFPSPMQKRMMSKRWNDVVWPLLHASFALLLLLLFVNALVGPVDGAGGRVAFEPSAAHEASFGESYYDPITKETYFPGDIYDCEPTAQEGKCRNSLAPLAGIEGETGIPSMPAGFYWDAWLAIFIAGAGLVATLATHYAIVPGWRARARAMKELELDHEAANSEEEDEDADDEEYDDEEYDDEEYDDEEYDDEEYDDEEYDDEEYEDEEYDDEAHDEEATEQDEDPIDIGSHVGLEVDGVDYFGTIVEFDDDEGTVTIEEDETGETIVGDQDAMFLE